MEVRSSRNHGSKKEKQRKAKVGRHLLHFKSLEFVWTSASLSDVGQTAEPLTEEQESAHSITNDTYVNEWQHGPSLYSWSHRKFVDSISVYNDQMILDN